MPDSPIPLKEPSASTVGVARLPKYDTHKTRKEIYSKIENLAFSIVTSARRLCSYFQVHTIRILTDQPLRKGLHKLDTSGRLMQWLVKLSEFDIEYHPRAAIKGKAVVDFLDKFTFESAEQENEP